MDLLAFSETAKAAAMHDQMIEDDKRSKKNQEMRYARGQMHTTEYIQYSAYIDRMIESLKDLRHWYSRVLRLKPSRGASYEERESLEAQRHSAKRQLEEVRDKIRYYSTLLLNQSELEYSESESDYESESDEEEESESDEEEESESDEEEESESDEEEESESDEEEESREELESSRDSSDSSDNSDEEESESSEDSESSRDSSDEEESESESESESEESSDDEDRNTMGYAESDTESDDIFGDSKSRYR